MVLLKNIRTKHSSRSMRSGPHCLILYLFGFAASVISKAVKHDLVLTWEVGSPNGQPREMIRMNGQFPGPELVWDEEDDVEVSTQSTVRSASMFQVANVRQVWVHNRMPFNTSIHWHGLMYVASVLADQPFN